MIIFIPINDNSLTKEERLKYGAYLLEKDKAARINHHLKNEPYRKAWIKLMQDYSAKHYDSKLELPPGAMYWVLPRWKKWLIRKWLNLKLIKKYGLKQVFTDKVD